MTDTIAAYTYDDFGHIIANNRSGAAADMTYEYDNLHGWLTRIASSKNFEQKLYRETEGKNRRYNGSISAMTWKTDNNTLRRYDYSYDGLNRLTNADYTHFASNRSGNVSETARWILVPDDDKTVETYSERFQYDKNSNITWLERLGYCSEIDEYDATDVLDIEYSGNQKKSMSDSGFEADYYGSMQCVDGADGDVEYAYDGNGNLTRDDNKGQTYEYDLLGHPLKVNGAKSTIEYVYAADGRKLRTKHKIYTSTTKKIVKTSTTKDYTNGYIFTNGKPSMYSFDGGYYSFDNQGKLNGCHYYISDYLGNNRMVVNAATNATEQVTHYYPYGALMGNISTKPDAQPFKYSGKELDLSDGLDLYDFEARQYDAGAPDFTSIDPHCESYYGISPYAYCAGDPINYIDPTGENIWELDQDGRVVNVIEDKSQDAFYSVKKNEAGEYEREYSLDESGNKIYNCVSFEYGTIESHRSITYKNQNGEVDNIDVFQVRGDGNGEKLFQFSAKLASGSRIEIGHIKCGIEGESGLNFVVNSHQKPSFYISTDGKNHMRSSEPAQSYLWNGQLKYGYTIREMNHSHPNSPNPSSADQSFRTQLKTLYGKNAPKTKIWVVSSGEYKTF